jgi:hypothetical protein
VINGLAGLVEQFTLPELTRVLRRTVLAALLIGIVAFVVAVLLSELPFGGGVCIGLGLGLANIRLVTHQTARVSRSNTTKPVRALASLTLSRLAVTTAIVVVLAIVVTSLGLGAVAGIAIFYFLFLANLIVSVLKHRGATT